MGDNNSTRVKLFLKKFVLSLFNNVLIDVAHKNEYSITTNKPIASCTT